MLTPSISQILFKHCVNVLLLLLNSLFCLADLLTPLNPKHNRLALTCHCTSTA